MAADHDLHKLHPPLSRHAIKLLLILGQERAISLRPILKLKYIAYNSPCKIVEDHLVIHLFEVVEDEVDELGYGLEDFGADDIDVADYVAQGLGADALQDRVSEGAREEQDGFVEQAAVAYEDLFAVE
jgi:hypothetical protein